MSWIELVQFNISHDTGKMQSWMADVCCSDFAVWEACVTEAMHLSHPSHNAERVSVKFWSQHLQYLQSYLETFISHSAAAVTLLETDNISPVCRYIVQIWHLMLAWTWKNCVLLAAFWDIHISFGPNGALTKKNLRKFQFLELFGSDSCVL